MITPIKINGINVYPYNSAHELIADLEARSVVLIAINATKMDDQLVPANFNEDEYIGYPDGISAIWALKKKGIKNIKRIPGCELWLEIIREFYRDTSFYLIGGKQPVVEHTVLNLKKEFPGINIKGFRNGYFRDEEINNIQNEIMAVKPDFIFIAMGSPDQELLMSRLYKEYHARYMGLGGSFDLYSGFTKRAPGFYLNLNLEWLYRMISQPWRFKNILNLVTVGWRILFNRI